MDEKKKILERIKKERVEFINFQFSDMFGNVKNTVKPVEELEDGLKGIWFDGSSVEGFARIQESDSLLVPDLSTFAVIPWSNDDAKEARFICDVFVPTKDGNIKPFEGDPRFILKQQIKKVREKGLIYNVGPEIEFFIFEESSNSGKLIPYDSSGYFDYSKDKAIRIRNRAMQYLKKIDAKAENSHSEAAWGQHEIDLRYGEALKTADRVLTLKSTLQVVAREFNCFISFMPKPIAGISGSGMHVHQSFFDAGGENVFYDSQDKYKLSQTAYYFVAGQIKHARALCAITNPTVNSYKRLVAGYEAPVHICWARNNRSALLRIPQCSLEKRDATRVELRCPDPSCNPYLAFAAMLAAGWDGIMNNTEYPKPTEENVYRLSSTEYKKHKITNLPASLREAIEELKKDKILMKVLGPHLGPKFLKAKMQEWDELRSEITPLEIEKYL